MMLFKKVFYITLIVCILSLFLYQNVSFAGMLGEVHGNKWKTEREELTNKWNDVDRSVNEYHSIHGQVETLIGSWSDTEDAVKAGTDTVIVRGGAAIIATGVAFASGGSFAPATWFFYHALKKGIETLSLDSSEYFDAMGAAVTMMYQGYMNVSAAYDGGWMAVRVKGVDTHQTTIGYAAQYKKYIKMCAEHNLAQKDANGNISSTAVSQTELDTQANMYNNTRGWYHAGATSSSSGEHVIIKRTELSHWQVKDYPEQKFKCEGGGCSDKYRTPWEAFTTKRVVCEYTRKFYGNGPGPPITYGPCKHVYYTCRHSHCPKSHLHGEPPEVGAGFSPSDGSYTASAGDSHTGIVTGSSIYGAYLYVNGTQNGWFGGTQSTTSLSLTYTFPSDASGSYTMMARVYPWSGSTYGNYTDYSYTVTVGSTTPSDTDDDDDASDTDTDDDDDTETDEDTSDTDTDDDDDDESSTGGSIGPASGYSDTSRAGLSYAVTLTGNSALSQVEWYVMAPGDASASLWSTQNYYDGVTTDAIFYWYFADNVSGDYVFTAEVTPWSGESYSTSFTVSVTAQ